MIEVRNPSKDPTPFDWASFYIESLKYGPGAERVEEVEIDEMVGQFEVLLRDAGVDSMDGIGLIEALEFYALSLAEAFGVPPVVTRSCFTDGVMHGIAYGASLRGELRNEVGS